MLRYRCLQINLLVSWTFFTIFLRGEAENKTTGPDKIVKIGVILPADNKYEWSLSRTIPALEVAIDTVEKNPTLLPGYKIRLNTNDSRCSDIYGPLASMNMQVNKRAHVFFGPSCEYAVAPIARYSPFWNIPVITAGALVMAFKNKTHEYKLLTRMQGTYAKAGQFFFTTTRYYKWKRIGLIYQDSNSGPNKVHSKCYFGVEALYMIWKNLYGTTPWHRPFDETVKTNFKEILREASLHARNTSVKNESALEVIKIGVLLPADDKYSWSLPRTQPALEYAVENVEQQLQLLPGYKIRLYYNDSKCSDTFGPLAAIEMYVQHLAHVFIGPACDYAVAPIARFSKYWGIPVLSAGALVNAFKNKTKYSLLTRLQGSFDKAGEFFLRMCKHFDWTTVGLFFNANKSDRKSRCYFALEAIFFHWKNVHKTELWHKAINETGSNFTGLLMDASTKTRIIVLCASPDTVREIMIRAHELNFDNGEYVFFNIDLFRSKAKAERPWYRENDTRNDIAKKAFQALMTVTLRKPNSPAYRMFSEEVKRRAQSNGSNFTYGEEEVNSFVGAFHDAVILYALALNETLEANGSISNGTEITRRMWNRTFEGITGNVSIDDNGDRNADYSLLDMTDPESGRFEVVANYYGKTKRYEPVDGKRIHWPGKLQQPPPDTPKCGFDGSKCPPDSPFPDYGIVISVFGTLLVIVGIAAVFLYRHGKLEAELKAMNWRVKWEDITFGTKKSGKKLERSASRLSLNRQMSMTSSCSGDTIAVHLSEMGSKQMFIRTGYYRGSIVAIKKVHRTCITVNKPLLMEIKRMKDLTNDYIVRFIGSCIDPPNMCILMEYCPKGSLQDVLENDQIKLDWMFRYSLMQDIVRGMAYLHGNEIKSHGNLKSSNCVIDSRFVLKLTDFGLHALRGQDYCAETDTYAYYQRLLWTAPEILRMHTRPPEGTQKGDVYSWSIIVQEIIYRNGVFYTANNEMSPREIYQKVVNGVRPYFRPSLDSGDCPSDDLANVIRKGWSEDPAERPDFQALKGILRRLNKDGDKGNILDNLLSRMEQYANNLEALVEERTSDYLEQKKKAEDLLYNMLPKYVAMQLIKGESVTAESYDNVSIYFSDICGFTAMSAESTPYQVVDLLNDLYTTFDSIIENYDVYKVETIGDAYMVVSGVPIRNGINHCREIARMALALLKAVKTFRIRHRPNEQLKLRIGIHTGSVCAGVVGLKMPRYCLFGDTVNTASRMESHGHPLKIHVSPQFKDILDQFTSFDLECRGPVEMKGKGKITTYWLLGETDKTEIDNIKPQIQCSEQNSLPNSQS